jgi:hypothetical protein
LTGKDPLTPVYEGGAVLDTRTGMTPVMRHLKKAGRGTVKRRSGATR